MKRLGSFATLLCSFSAAAHVVGFDFVYPSGAGNRVGDAGTLQWFDAESPGSAATLIFFLSRDGVSPLQRPDGGRLNETEIYISEPTNLLSFDTAGLEAGCYQPYVLIKDPVEGAQVRSATGSLTVLGDGGNVPPSIEVLNPVTEMANDAGVLLLRWSMDEPDDDSTVRIDWHTSSGRTGSLASGLPLTKGTRTGSYSVSQALLPNDEAAYLQVTIESADGRRCDSWWAGFLGSAAAPDAGEMNRDAGPSEPSDAGTTPTERTGCGCSAGDGSLVFAALVAFGRRRRGRGRPGFPGVVEKAPNMGHPYSVLF